MQRCWKRGLFVLLAVGLLTTVASAADTELLENGALADPVNGVPAGWSVKAYDTADALVETRDGETTLSCRESNDLRLCQTVEVEGNAVYLLTAEISAARVSGGKGATLSIDNYAIDGCCIYSDSVYGNTDWQRVSLAFRTNAGQQAVVVALRLGGYSETGSGAAGFRNVSLTQGDASLPNIRTLTDWGEPAQVENDEGMSESREIFLKSVFDIMICAAVLAGVVLLFGLYRNRQRLAERQMDDARRKKLFAVLVLLGFALRSVLNSAWGGHDSDMSCWVGWGSYIANEGCATFYTAPGHDWYDYPPAYMLILGGLTRLLQSLNVSLHSDAGTFAYMLPAFVADILCAILLMGVARRSGWSESAALTLGGLVVLNPAIVFLSGAWGQIDSILTLCLLLTFLAVEDDRRILAGALFGLAIAFKWQALIYGPVLAVYYLLRVRGLRDALRTAASVLAAFAVIWLISLPFRGEQSALWLIDRFLNASGGYDYASVEAYNFLALCGGNWAPADRVLALGVTYRQFGTAAILLAVLLAVGMQAAPVVRAGIAGERPPARRELLFLSAAFCMYMIFTFGHYMHERYIFPVLLLLLFAYVLTRDKRLLLCSLLLTVVLFLNEMCAMYVISDLASAVVRSGREHNDLIRLCAAGETASFVYFAWVCRDVCKKATEGGAAA